MTDAGTSIVAAGYRYATANNGLEALNAFRGSSFDAILMVSSFLTVSSLWKISHVRPICWNAGLANARNGWFDSNQSNTPDGASKCYQQRERSVLKPRQQYNC